MSLSNLNSCCSIQDLINYDKKYNIITFDTLCKFDEDNSMGYNVLYDYKDELLACATNVNNITDAEYAKYMYKPKLLAADLYGNPEYYYVLLIINDITSPKEFTMKNLKLINSNVLISLLSLIYNKEKAYL